MESFSLFGFLFAPVNAPFAIALGILGGLLVIEIATLVIGIPLSAKVDAMLDLHGPDLHGPDLHGPDVHGPDVHGPDVHGPHVHGPDTHAHGGHAGLDVAHEPGMFGTAWDWLNAGRVPLLILIMIMLGSFGALGYMIEGVSHSFIGWLPTFMAAVAAFIVTIPVTRRMSLLVSKVVPRDETYVVEAGGLVGQTGIIVTGPLAQNTIARVKVRDVHGNHHFPWVRTKDPNLKLDNGDHVLLVEHIGSEYLAIAADPKLIA
jgi:hypothetical protein